MNTKIIQEGNKSYLFFISITAAFGGFLFGYDTAVISGMISLVKKQFFLSTIMEGWFVSSALVGCVLGVILAGFLSDKYGRKSSLIFSGFLFCVSAIGCTLCGSVTELIFFRFTGGLGIGIASMVSPLYISEISPAAVRGRMVVLYQLSITVGILIAYFVNAWLLAKSLSCGSSLFGIEHKIFVTEVWRAMFGSSAIPALLFFVAVFFVPESPRWFASKGKKIKANKILSKINGSNIGNIELNSILQSLCREEKGEWKALMLPGIKVAMIAGILLALLSQFTGINAIIYYGPRIMEEAGLKLGDALGGQVIIGIVNVLATFIAIWKIDNFGRKKLLNTGVTGMFFSLLIVGLLFLIGKTDCILLLVFILLFIIFFEIGYGSVIWVLLSEIYPTKIRSKALSVATLSLWIGTAIIGQIVPWMLETLSAGITFLVFAFCCIPVPLILRLIPETKGKSLEEIEKCWNKE